VSRLRLVGTEIRQLDSVSLSLGVGLTIAAVYASHQAGPAVGLGAPLALLAFASLVVAWVVAPHLMVAGVIALFALIPTLKLVVPAIGATKEALVSAAVVATLVVCIRRGRWPADHWTLGAVLLLLALYVVNLGGGFAEDSFDLAWLHGVRLVSEPLLLLLAGLSLAGSPRTMRWALGSLIVTASGVALVGLGQQVLGPERLIAFGYDYNEQVRTFAGQLRSFGTLDEPFAYAAFLLFGLAAVLFTMRRGPLAFAAGSLIAVGLAASLARTAAVVSVALLGLWLARRGHTAVALLLTVASVAAAVAFLVASGGGTESRTVRAGSSTYLTINGRTDAWRLALGEPSEWPFGRGVGEIGTAAERAQLAISPSEEEARDKSTVAVDSGYFAAIADIGLVGFGVLAGLLWRLAALSRRAIGRGQQTGWLAAGLLTVLLLDAVTRASFTAFPTAYLGLLLTGIAIRVVLDERATHETTLATSPQAGRALLVRPSEPTGRHAGSRKVDL